MLNIYLPQIIHVAESTCVQEFELTILALNHSQYTKLPPSPISKNSLATQLEK